MPALATAAEEALADAQVTVDSLRREHTGPLAEIRSMQDDLARAPPLVAAAVCAPLKNQRRGLALPGGVRPDPT